jgi:hypothetical protein
VPPDLTVILDEHAILRAEFVCVHANQFMTLEPTSNEFPVDLSAWARRWTGSRGPGESLHGLVDRHCLGYSHEMKRWVPSLIALAAVLAAAGCGGSTATTTVVRTVTESASPTVTATTESQTDSSSDTQADAPTSSTDATTGSITTSSGTSPALPSSCRAADLSLSFLGQQGATGHGELGFALKNTSSNTCTAVGYPGVLFFGRAGSPLPTIPDHTTQDLFGSTPLLRLAVAPGKSVSFRLTVTHGIDSTAGCSTAYSLRVTPPRDTATLRVSIPDGAYQCQKTTVSPLQPGDSAYP